MEQYLRQGLAPDSKVLDIRQVDVSTGRFLEDNTPVYVITFTTQEVLLFRDRKTREVVVGAENRVEQCNYAAVITRVEEDLENELTGGWKVIEVRGSGGFFFFFVSGLITEHRWRVGRGVHIYNLLFPPTIAMGFTSKTNILSSCFVARTHDTLLSLTSHHHSHHHSRSMYTHILICRYYRVGPRAILDFNRLQTCDTLSQRVMLQHAKKKKR
jgi:hypothetical protein